MQKSERNKRSLSVPSHLGVAGLCSLMLACQAQGTSEPERTSRARELPSRLIAGGSAEAQIIAESSAPQAEHCDQSVMNAIEDPLERFIFAFDCGDELFEVTFNELDGVGANVGQGQRFTRVPRADLNGTGEWLNHVPARATGPNAQACNECHELPFDDGAGAAALNVIRDPNRSGVVAQFVNRNTPHVFAPGALQRLAEEMADALAAQREEARLAACANESVVNVALAAKGIGFGSMVVACNPASDDTSGVQGIDADLLVRPFQWKGNTITLRDFNRGAGHNELGMQALEISGDGEDGDGDGVVNEFGVGDITALTIYLAAQPRPVTKIEMADAGLMELSDAERASIQSGEQVFAAVGCADCHRPSLVVDDPIFSEPSQHPGYRDALFPIGLDPLDYGLDPENPITFDLTVDPPDNEIETESGTVHLGHFPANDQGGAVVSLYGDLKRHDMGPGLAESVDEAGTGPSVWMTKELWGVGSTAPYLHDGRATTLMSAILEHGGEAAASREALVASSVEERNDLVAFLSNLILFKAEEEEGEAPPPEGNLTAVFVVQADWGAGYCGELRVTNPGDTATTAWSASLDTNGSTITGSWNGDFSGTSGAITIVAPFEWNRIIAAGATNASIGFCAERDDAGSGLLPANIVANGTF